MPFLFGFGKKRRSVKRKSTKKVVKKPSARLLKCCKRYHVKATKKVGSKRVYKKSSVLKRQCLKKARALLKKMKKMHKKKSVVRSSGFGKRRSAVKGRKVSKAAAMKAFKMFYKRHCAGSRRSRFGSGGNPALAASMGYEFCPDGSGGVLGVNSTGLFPSPCGMTAATMSVATPPTTGNGVRAAYEALQKQYDQFKNGSQGASFAGTLPPRPAFGRRRRSAVVMRKKRSSAVGMSKKRSSAVGMRRRKRRSSAVGSCKKQSSFGRRRRRRCPM